MLDDARNNAGEVCPFAQQGSGEDAGVGQEMTARFLKHIASDAFPCVGAKAALARSAIEVHEFGAIADTASDVELLEAIRAFGGRLALRDPQDSTAYSLVAIFSDTELMSEEALEHRLWSLLQRLHHIDAEQGVAWATSISTDPDSPRFSLSLGGTPFFIIGLHPGASRLGRRFARPVLVFNSHEQFEELREDGRYQKMQAATRARDRELQGSINPNLADFGAASEARQYSGRAVGADWRCPFHVERLPSAEAL